MSLAYGRDRAAVEIARLREQLPDGIVLWVGGGGSPEFIPGSEHFSDLLQLDSSLGQRLR